MCGGRSKACAQAPELLFVYFFKKSTFLFFHYCQDNKKVCARSHAQMEIKMERKGKTNITFSLSFYNIFQPVDCRDLMLQKHSKRKTRLANAVDVRERLFSCLERSNLEDETLGFLPIAWQQKCKPTSLYSLHRQTSR